MAKLMAKLEDTGYYSDGEPVERPMRRSERRALLAVKYWDRMGGWIPNSTRNGELQRAAATGLRRRGLVWGLLKRARIGDGKRVGLFLTDAGHAFAVALTLDPDAELPMPPRIIGAGIARPSTDEMR